MKKEMLTRIHKTISAYYEINKEVLSEEKLNDLIEQKKAVKTELKKFWKR